MYIPRIFHNIVYSYYCWFYLPIVAGNSYCLIISALWYCLFYMILLYNPMIDHYCWFCGPVKEHIVSYYIYILYSWTYIPFISSLVSVFLYNNIATPKKVFHSVSRRVYWYICSTYVPASQLFNNFSYRCLAGNFREWSIITTLW